ncbi:MAG: DNA polymerase III subunit chi [Hydrogenophaga sp.]|nr:DNA polymerase III subunit chi [Hydrogenophaga sp.]
MPEVAFHFNAPDKLAYTARLLRKAYLKGARVVVLSPREAIDELDRLIWLVGQGDFVPHARPGDAAAVQRHSPIRLTDRLDGGDAAAVLVNLQDAAVPEPGAFARVIEVVGTDEADRAAARQRWRTYAASGIEPLRHDLKQADA